MIDTQAVTRSLPLVASVLARKYGVNVKIGGIEAHTKGEISHLPALPVDRCPDSLAKLVDSQFHGVRGQIEVILGNVRRNCRSTLGAIDAVRQIVRILEQVVKPARGRGVRQRGQAEGSSLLLAFFKLSP